MEIKLPSPITINGEDVSALQLHEPTGRDMVQLCRWLPSLVQFAERSEHEARTIPAPNETEAIIAVAAILTRIEIAEAENLPWAVILRVIEESRELLANVIAEV